MVALTWAVLSAFTLAVHAGTVQWNGSWADEVGEYQWYIHGSGNTSEYLALDPSYKNPADTTESHGIKMTIDSTSNWSGQTMERTELIPQTSNNLGTGELFYHFSVMTTATNPPNSAYEHQVCFFESHFTELKYGVGSTTTDLVWMVTEVIQWSSPFTPGTWFNFAYDINFTAGTVGLWASTGSDPLVEVVQPVSASASSNSEDWHLGVLRLVTADDVEDWYFSGVYVESGPITTTIGAAPLSGTTTSSSSSSSSSTTSSSSSSSSTTATTTTSSSSSSSTTSTTTSTASTVTVTHYGQCGGTGYTGPTVCATGYTCTAVAPPYYYQFLTGHHRQCL
ncbi:hypothetical protein H0H92_015350 [Tricholoma furcatifolium]|nr:hypothetical protein H0H92_015350 [Tricholoma furcatifolium]